MLRKVFFCASAIALIASCTEEDLSLTAVSSQLKSVQPENDLTFGYNSIITETDSLSTVSIPLNTDVAPVISCSDGVADLQCVNIDGKYYLQVANPEKAKLGVDEVTLTVKGHPELTKSFYFTVRKSYANTRALAPTDKQDKINRRFADVFSQGQYIWKTSLDDHPTSPMFRAEALYESLSSSLPLFNVDKVLGSTDELIEASGSTLEEYASNFSINAGLDNIPISKVLFGIGGSYTTKSVSKHYYEYITKSRSEFLAGAKLSESMKSTPAHDKYWKELITQELDNVLNNPNTKEYKKFAETDKGACEIIEAYGSHMLTYCKLGTKAVLNFRKKQDLKRTSSEWALSVKVKWDANKGKDLKKEDDVLCAKYIDDKAFNGSLSLGGGEEKLLEEIEAEWSTKLFGGNIATNKTYDGWSPTDDPENWFPVSVREENKKAELRAIYELCQDPESPRCQTLKRVLEEVDEETGLSPFAEYQLDNYGVNLNPDETEWVLAGIYVDVDASTSNDKIPGPTKMELPADRSKKETFYPFMDLAYHRGDCLDTQIHNFGRCDRRKCHYWYYAYKMRDDFPGISEFRLVEKDREQEFKNKGYHSCLNWDADEFGDGWTAGETNNYVLMGKKIGDKDKTTQPITGFRLEGWYHNYRQGDHELAGVSGLTGPGLNSDYNRYNYFWQGTKEYPISYVKNDDDEVDSVYALFMVHQPRHLFLSTTKRPIRKDDIYFEHPKNMNK